MKKISHNLDNKAIFLFVILLAAFTGCKKEEINTQPTLDKQVFFSIRMDGIDYATYGYIDQYAATPYGGPTLTKTEELDIAGRTYTKITLLANNNYVRPVSNPAKSDSLPLGNCTLKMAMQKEGSDLLGVYHSFAGFLTDQKITNNAYEEYYVGGVGDLTIDRELTHPVNKAKMIEGHCFLRIYTTAGGFYKEFNASGTFRMYLI